MTSQRFHDGLVLVDTQTPYKVCQFPTIAPTGDEILVHVKWTASTPLDLHQAAGGLNVEYPMRTGSTGAGVVVEVGPRVKHFKVGQRVVGFAHQKPAWKTHQQYATAPEWVFGKIPDNLSFQQAVTLPENLVTAFNTISTDLKLPTPWPKPADYQPPRADEHILIWGAASSVGQLTIQVLRYYGYEHIVATASSTHHAHIKDLGASYVYDYKSPTIVDDLLEGAKGRQAPAFPLIVDCIGSQQGSLKPISKVAQSGSTVAVMLPVILKPASNDSEPQYSMDVSTSAEWAPGVSASGVRTFLYWRNEMFREKLQTEMIPALLEQGVVKPNRYRVVEGGSLLERAKKALDIMREGASGEKIIWRVSEE
ncbi:GroES-like protein [Astrocystis sublimbata]|nr:GroES-like protein [Astrocystis sublimbata]